MGKGEKTLTDGEAPFTGIRHLQGLFDVAQRVGFKPTDGINRQTISSCSGYGEDARKLAKNINQSNSIATRVPSILISGRGNFPVGKKEQQNRAVDANMEEWRQIQGLLDKIRGTGMGGISADGPDAVDKLKAKLERLEAFQDKMKAVNAYYRKHKTLDGCPHLSIEEIEKLKAEMACSWRAQPKPYESYALSNNNASIRQVKARIEELARQAEPTQEPPKINTALDNIAAQYYNFLHECYPLPRDEDIRAAQIDEVIQFLWREGKTGADQLSLAIAGLAATPPDNPTVQNLASVLMAELAKYNEPGRADAQRQKRQRKKSQER